MRPRALAALRPLALMLLALAALWLAAACASAADAPPSDGDWTVTTAVTLEDGAAIMRGDLTIGAGGELTLRDYTLLFDCSRSMEFGIAVRPGGALRVLDGSMLGATKPGLHWTAYAENGSTVRIIGSTVSWCGAPEWGEAEVTTNWRNISFCVETGDAVIERSLFKGGHIGLSFPGPGTAPPVRNCTFRNHFGVCTATTWVEDCTFEGANISKGAWVFNNAAGTVVRVLRCYFEDASASGVEVYHGEALVVNCTFKHSSMGVMGDVARAITVEGCTFDGMYQVAVRGDDSTIHIVDGYFKDLETTTAIQLGGLLDWEVRGESTVEGGSVLLSGNLTLLPGARMRLLGCRNLTMLSSEASPLEVILGAGSELELSGTTLDVPDEYDRQPYGWPVVLGGAARLVLRDVVRLDVGGPVVLEELEAHRSRLPLGNWTVHRVHLEGCDLTRTAEAGPHRLTVGRPDSGTNDVGALVGCGLVGLPGNASADGPWLDLLGGGLTSLDFLHGLEGMLARGEVRLPGGQGGAILLATWTVTVEVYWQNGYPAPGAVVTVRNAEGHERAVTAGDDGIGVVMDVRTERAVGESSSQSYMPLTIEATSHGSTGRETLAEVESPPKVVVVITDGTPPTLRLDQPGRIGTRAPRVVLSGSVRDGESGVALLEVQLSRQGPALVNVSWPSGTFELPVKLGSPYTTVSFRLYDQAGNSASAEVIIFYWTQPPIVFSIEPSAEVVVNTSHIEVWGETERNITVESFGRSVETAKGGFRLLVPLVEGRNLITVNFTDLAGNRNSTTVRVVRDTMAPGLEVTRPTGGSLLTNEGAQVIEGRVDVGCRVLVNSVELDVDATGGWSALVALTVGRQSFTVSAIDEAGNVLSTSVEFTLDDAPPSLSVAHPPEGGMLTNAPSLQVAVEVDPDATLTLNGAPLAVGNGSVRSTFSLKEGDNELLFVATDALGNRAEAVRTVTFHGPPLPLELDPDLPPRTASPVYRISGKTAAGARVTVNGIQMAVDVDGAFSGTFFLQDGVNRLRVEARDVYGNVANASLSVEVSEPPPDVSGPAPSLLPGLIVASVLVLLAEAVLLLRSRAKREST